MTSTNFNVGLDATSRLTSRVLKPPGGGHTDIFGGSEPEVPRGRRHQVSSIVLGNENSNEVKPTNGTSASIIDSNENKTVAPAPTPEPEIVDNQPKQGSPKQEATKQASPKAEPAKAEPPKRVRVPPGGFSSGLW